MVASFYASVRNFKPTMEDFNEDGIRHLALSMIRNARMKFKKDFGEIVICCDKGRSWRNEVFPYYKARRKESREESNLDWGVIFQTFEKIIEEIDDYFPYKVIRLDGVEADDIIGTICHRFGAQLGDGEERILIVSNDKDFKQLHSYSNIEQWTSKAGKIVVEDPEDFLLTQLIKGDSDDGIPNVLSDDNTLVIRKRQVQMIDRRVKALKDAIETDTFEGEYANAKEKVARNRILIDLSMVPSHIKEKINNAYDQEKKPAKGKLFNYFFDKKLKMLMENIGDFK